VIQGLGDDVVKKTRKLYIAFQRTQNFACVEVHPQANELLIFVKVDPDSVQLEEGFSRDMRNIGHFGTGDLELRVRSQTDLEKAFPLIRQSYEAS
jgi:predicted transport protein